MCGMDLYCPGATPPLIGGAKTCTGTSKVGEGCNDVLRMGVCMTSGLEDCMEACRRNAKCESIVYYSKEQKGSCVLCGDLVHTVPTPHATTRIYSRVPYPPPPTPVGAAWRGYHVDHAPAPPSAAGPGGSHARPGESGRGGARALPPPPMSLEHLGYHTAQHFECTFAPHVELSVDTPVGYTNAQATTRFECCNLCGLHPGCQDFVYQHATSLCVLLPHATAAELVRTPNPNVVSGSLAITAVAAAGARHGECTFEAAAGYTGDGARITIATTHGLSASHQMAITSKQDCCDACLAHEGCTKLSFHPEALQCTLYRAFAEAYSTDGMIAGVLTSRYTGGSATGVSGATSLTPSGEMVTEPALPPLVTAASPPAPPPTGSGTSDLTKSVMSAVSLGMGGMMLCGLLMCASCFISQDVRRLLGRLAGGSAQVSNGSLQPLSAADDGNGGDGAAGGGGAGAPRGGSRRQGGPRDKDGGAARRSAGGSGGAAGTGQITVRACTSAMTQTRELDLAECEACAADFDALVELLIAQFPALLRDRKKGALVLQCTTVAQGRSKRGARGGGAAGAAGAAGAIGAAAAAPPGRADSQHANGGGGAGGGGVDETDAEGDWMRVTPKSDLMAVLAESTTLRLVEKEKTRGAAAARRENAALPIAFPKGSGGGGKNRWGGGGANDRGGGGQMRRNGKPSKAATSTNRSRSCCGSLIGGKIGGKYSLVAADDEDEDEDDEDYDDHDDHGGGGGDFDDDGSDSNGSCARDDEHDHHIKACEAAAAAAAAKAEAAAATAAEAAAAVVAASRNRGGRTGGRNAGAPGAVDADVMRGRRSLPAMACGGLD